MKYFKTRKVKSPERGTPYSAGIDFFVPLLDRDLVIEPHRDILMPSGIKMQIPDGYMLMAANKSGVATSKGACLDAGVPPKDDAFESIVVVGAKIVDQDYQGEIFIHLVNVGDNSVVLKANMKIAQFILVPVSYEGLTEVATERELFDKASIRGTGGFGSTNINQ